MYNLILTGKLEPGTNPRDALAGLAKLLKVDDAKAREIVRNAPVCIRRNTDAAMAERVVAAMKAIGIRIQLEPVAAAPAAGTGAGEVASTVGAANAVSASKTTNSSVNAKPARSEQPSTSLKVIAGGKPAAAKPADKPQTLDGQQTAQISHAPAVPESFKGFRYQLSGQPDYCFISVEIPAGETIKVEASAMASMTTNMLMKTRAKGGLSRFMSGESVFINEFTADTVPGEIGIAPGSPGDVKHLYLDNEEVFLQNSAFVASGMGVVAESKWQGFTKGFFSGESLFLIRCSGQGDLWFNTYGAMIEIDVAGDYVVDTGNIVGFTSGLEYDIQSVGGYKSLFFSGEGLICRFRGHGKVWIQTRSVPAFANWANWYRPVKKK